MRKLVIPDLLKVEFATIEALWSSNAQTRRVDSLLLSWVKYEKQLRRLFSFLVYQHPNFNQNNLESVIGAFVDSRNLYPETFIAGISKLGVTPVPRLLGEDYKPMWAEIQRIKKYRNKIMHGQVTGQAIKSPQLEADVLHLVSWINALAVASQREFGYDGLKRNTYVAAASSARIIVENYPFSSPAELKQWLAQLGSGG
jgi:hypothetical protein